MSGGPARGPRACGDVAGRGAGRRRCAAPAAVRFAPGVSLGAGAVLDVCGVLGDAEDALRRAGEHAAAHRTAEVRERLERALAR